MIGADDHVEVRWLPPQSKAIPLSNRLPEALSGGRTKLESQLQRAVKVSAKGKQVQD